MHYDDSDRRQNLLRGLLVGAVLGAGLVFLLAPSDRAAARKARALLRGPAGRLGDAARRALDEMEHAGGGRPASGEAEGSAPRRRFTL